MKIKRPADKVGHKILKIAMMAVYLWSGFFWAGVTALNFLINDLSNVHLAYRFAAGSLVLLLGLILAWLRLYVLQIIPCMAGLAVFLNPAREMIDRAAETGVLFKPTFEQRYLPIIAFAIFSLVLFILRVWGIFAARAERKNEFDNMPTESVLDKHHGE